MPTTALKVRLKEGWSENPACLSDFTERAICPREQRFAHSTRCRTRLVVRRRSERLPERACEMAHRQAALASQRRQSDRAIQMFPEQIDHSPLLPGRQTSTRTRDSVHRGRVLLGYMSAEQQSKVFEKTGSRMPGVASGTAESTA